jgi:hypothetical protein
MDIITQQLLTDLSAIRVALKQSIENKGITVPEGTSFLNYAAKVEEISGGGSGSQSDWVRPSEWLPAPSIAGNQLYFLMELRTGYPNVMAFILTYYNAVVPMIIDWGDGTVPVTTVADGFLKTKIYDYNDPYFLDSLLPDGTKQVVIKITIPSFTPDPQIYNQLYLRRLNVGGAEVPYNINGLGSRVLEVKSNIAFKTVYIDKMELLENISLPVSWVSPPEALYSPGKSISIQNCGVKNLQLTGQSGATTTSIVIGSCMFLTSVTCPSNTNVYLYTTGVESVSGVNGISVAEIGSSSTAGNALKSLTFSSPIDLNNLFFFKPKLRTLDFRGLAVTYLDPLTYGPAIIDFLDQYYLQELYLGDTGIPLLAQQIAKCYQLRSLEIPANAFQFVFSVDDYGLEVNQLSVVDCTSLQKLTILSTYPLYTDFSGCPSLLEVEFGTGSMDVMTYLPTTLFTNCRSVYSVKNCRLPVSFSLANLYLSATALNTVYTDLPTVVGQTINVQGNPGTTQAGHNPTIATSKGWTVTV